MIPYNKEYEENITKGVSAMKQYESKNEYVNRINKVQNYIERNITKTFTLEELSEVAGFSKYHFHRIFKAITHESLLQYVNRIKLEVSTGLLSHRQDMSITDIAYYLGFSDSAVYSRSFKQYYGVSPSNYRDDYRKNCKDQYNISRYNKDVSDKLNQSVSKQEIEGKVEIIMMDSIKVAYLRFTGAYIELSKQLPKLMEQLFINAYNQNLLIEGETKVLCIYHDNPEFTNPDDLKTSICITLPDGAVVDENSELSVMEIPAGEYMVGHFYIRQDQFSAMWDYIYEEWLTNSGYVPSDNAPFEVYMNDYRNDKHGMHLVDIYLPVQPFAF